MAQLARGLWSVTLRLVPWGQVCTSRPRPLRQHSALAGPGRRSGMFLSCPRALQGRSEDQRLGGTGVGWWNGSHSVLSLAGLISLASPEPEPWGHALC